MAEANANSRLEAFCDGVFAIAVTLLIIDVKLPADVHVDSAADLWRAIGRLAPTLLAFLLSFLIILISWVNHHGLLKLVHKSSVPFMYANGFLLLGVVLIPFPTAMIGEYLSTPFAGPPVVIYNAVLATLAAGWILIAGTALDGGLAKNERASDMLRESRRNGYFGFAFYALLALAAVWFPIGSAVVNGASWLFWLVYGLRLKHE